MYTPYQPARYPPGTRSSYYYPSNPIATVTHELPRERRYAPTPSEVRRTKARATVAPLVSVTFRHAELADETPEPDDEQPLQLTNRTLDKLMTFPEDLQKNLLRLIEQQNQIRLAQLAPSPPPAGCPPGRAPPLGRAPPPLGRAGRAPPPTSLDEIRRVNQENLALAANSHLKAEPLQSRGGVEFSDEAAVMQTLIELNPAWKEQPEVLMAAMKAKLGGGGAMPAEPPAKIDAGWEKVKQQVTHHLEIADSEGNVVRCVPAVLVYEAPLVYVLPELLEPAECDRLLELTAAHWQTSTERMAKLPRNKNDFCVKLLRRFAAALQCGEDEIEDVFMVHYKAGETCGEHLDSARRCCTLLVYLNDLPHSGQTDFPKLGFQVQPQKGTGVFWYNVLKEGGEWTSQSDERTAHASLAAEEAKFLLAVYQKNPKFS